MADGLTVPFALAAGLSAAVSSTRIIATAGMAEIVAGAIAMGLGGHLAARIDQEQYESEERREFAEVEGLKEREVAEVEDIFKQYGLAGEPLRAVVGALTSDRKRWVEFMMRFELGLERPDPKRAPSARGSGDSHAQAVVSHCPVWATRCGACGSGQPTIRLLDPEVAWNTQCHAP